MEIIPLPDGHTRVSRPTLPRRQGERSNHQGGVACPLRGACFVSWRLATAVAMVFGAFAGGASAKKISKTQKADDLEAAAQADQEEPARNPQQVVPAEGGSGQLQAPGHDSPSRRVPGGRGRRGSVSGRRGPGTPATPALNERGTASANVDLGPSLGQRPVNLRGSLAAEVQFRDTYDGGALGNVSIEILPSNTKTMQTNSVPLLWNPDVDSLSSRIDANFARAAIRAGASVAPVLCSFHGWENKLQGCTDCKNEAAPASRTFALAGSFAGGVAGDGSYSALWYGTLGCRARTAVCRASRSSTRRSATHRRRRTSCRCSRASTTWTTWSTARASRHRATRTSTSAPRRTRSRTRRSIRTRRAGRSGDRRQRA